MHSLTCRGSLKVGLVLISGISASALAFGQDPPVAPVRPVTTDYFGTKVVDNYRYMEDLANPDVKAWMKAQADYTRAKLDAIPARKPLLDRIHALLNADVRRGGFVRRGDRYFYEVFEPGAQLPKLFYRDGLKGEEHLLLDPGAMGKGTDTHYALDYFAPSWDGKLLAYGLSVGGSEKSVLHVMDVKTGAVQAESIDRTSDSLVSWRPDNRSFFYLRYGKPVPACRPTRHVQRTDLSAQDRHKDGRRRRRCRVRPRRVQELRRPERARELSSSRRPTRSPRSGSPTTTCDNPSTVYVSPLSQVTTARRGRRSPMSLTA